MISVRRLRTALALFPFQQTTPTTQTLFYTLLGIVFIKMPNFFFGIAGKEIEEVYTYIVVINCKSIPTPTY